MKSPAFWWAERPTPAARLLAGLGAAYGAATARRMRQPGASVEVPVICVGNLVAGGAGKTPTALALAGLMTAAGRHPAFLSRGYGRRSPADAAFRVDPARHDAATAGDEPLLLARQTPTYVGADRRATARLAIDAGADCLILDDGLQNPTLAKNWTLAVVDGGTGHGNGLCFPAGPLRAPAALQWPFVSMLCVIGAGAAGERAAAAARAAGVPVTAGRLVPDEAVLSRWRDRPVFAFAGIGRPKKFFETLRDGGIALAGTYAFPDHHPFTTSDLRRLEQHAGGHRLVTTAKDRVRLPSSFAAEALPVDLIFDDPAALVAAMGLTA